MAANEPKLCDLFSQASECQTAEEQAAFLEQACQGNAELRAQLEELLQAHRQVGSFLQEPSPARAATVEEPPAGERPGTMIGPYKLLQQIGEGGMGTVFMAEQTRPVRRKVAVKVIKPGMDSRQVVARFEAERQALALMDHVNIARVLDAGTTGAGRPYFVMELVQGVPITRYCDDNHLTPRQRLELFVPVCQAIQHAHQKGIIHRDIKPSNVMVTLYDGKPVPKVIDFGVAKATDQRLTEKTLFTQYGAMVGTLEYMSPEQAEMSALGVDTRSDVYSLGVLLYELLTGSTPLFHKRVKEAAYAEVLRMIREEEPPRPSTRLSDSGETLASISANRDMEPAKLTKLVRGELDWIVMKCLEKDRSRRYESASAFAADMQRYLHDEPVQACPPSTWYRLRKLARRNKGPVLAASLVLLALVGGIIGTTWGMIHATAEAKQKDDALTDKVAALAAAKKSKREADEKLLESYLGQARGIRLSKRPGQRFESLEVLKRATDLARSLALPAEKFHELRNGVIASLALPDLYLTGPWIPVPAGTHASDSDEAQTIFVQTDRRGNCSVRRVADRAELHRLRGLGEPAIPFLSRDGKFLAVVHSHELGPAYTGVAVHLWSLKEATARQIASEKNARRVDFHPRGHQVALAYNDGTIRLFELPSGRQLGMALPPNTLTREIEIALHPREPLVAVSSYFSREVQIRDVRSGDVLASLPQATGTSRAVWHPDGQTLAVGAGEGGLIRLYDRTTLQPYRTLQCGSGGGLQLTFNHGGDRLAACGWNSAPELFDVGTGQKLFATTGYMWPRFSRDDQRLVGARDRKMGVWQVGDGREYRTLVRKAQPGAIYHSVALHPEGRLLAAGTTDGFGLWDLATGSELAFVPLDGGSNSGVADLRFEPSGALLTASVAGVFRWPLRADVETPDRLSIGPPERLLPRAHRIGHSDDGKVLVGCNRAVSAWQAYAGGWILHADRPDQPIRLDAGADIACIVVSPNGRWVVTVTQVGLAKVWDARDGSLVKPLAEWGAHYPCFSPDSLWLSTLADGGRVFAVGAWEPGPRVGTAGVFAPDSRLMAVQPTTGVIRLVDRDTGREFAGLEDPELDVTHRLFFTPDGTKLIGLGNKKVKAIRVWDLRLIRQRLKALGLDWDRPDYPPPGDAPAPSAVGPKVSVVGLERLTDWTIWRDRAKCHYDAKRWGEAVASFSKAIELNPDDAHCWNQRGVAHCWLGQKDKAVADFARAVKLNPAQPVYWCNRGSVYGQVGQYDKAVADYTKAIELESENKAIWSKRAGCYAELGQWKEATADYARAVELNKDDAPLWYRQALARLHMGDVVGYRKLCADMLGHFGSAAKTEAAHWTVWTCVLAGDAVADWKVALQLAEKAVADNPNNYRALNHQGAVLYRASQYQEALKRLTEAEAAYQLDDKKQYASAYNGLFLAMAHHRLGHVEEAQKWLSKAVQEIDRPTPEKAPAGPSAWNRRRTLQLLRREAEELLKQK